MKNLIGESNCRLDTIKKQIRGLVDKLEKITQNATQRKRWKMLRERVIIKRI